MNEKKATAKRASVSKRRSAPGGKEEPGDGVGDGDGGSMKEKGDSGFVFGQTEIGKKAGTVTDVEPSVNLKTGTSRSSYRDKLLAPGCAGFLMKHKEEDDIVRGWKNYFHQMNEKEGVNVIDETEEEDDRVERQKEGKAVVLNFTAEEYAAWCLPWANSLIIKVLGASFPTYIVRDRINRMWRLKDSLKLIPISNGYYIVSFSNKEDRDYAFQEGPWMIEDHYLIVQRWRPNFNPWKADIKSCIAAWVRLPDVPFEFYNVESLRRIGNKIGKMIKIDRSTSIYDKGGFARICVELDLQQPLVPSYMIFGEERPIIYEGLHNVCFSCGRYGHQKDKCPASQKVEGAQPVGAAVTDNSGKGDPMKEEKPMNGATVVTGSNTPGDSPFRKLQVLRRDMRV